MCIKFFVLTNLAHKKFRAKQSRAKNFAGSKICTSAGPGPASRLRESTRISESANQRISPNQRITRERESSMNANRRESRRTNRHESRLAIRIAIYLLSSWLFFGYTHKDFPKIFFRDPGYTHKEKKSSNFRERWLCAKTLQNCKVPTLAL